VVEQGNVTWVKMRGREHTTKINNRKSKAIKTINVYCDGQHHLRAQGTEKPTVRGGVPSQWHIIVQNTETITTIVA